MFENLQSFLDIYYAGSRVLPAEQDYLTAAHPPRMAAEHVRHVDHTMRGLEFGMAISGIQRAPEDGRPELGDFLLG